MLGHDGGRIASVVLLILALTYLVHAIELNVDDEGEKDLS